MTEAPKRGIRDGDRKREGGRKRRPCCFFVREKPRVTHFSHVTSVCSRMFSHTNTAKESEAAERLVRDAQHHDRPLRLHLAKVR